MLLSQDRLDDPPLGVAERVTSTGNAPPPSPDYSVAPIFPERFFFGVFIGPLLVFFARVGPPPTLPPAFLRARFLAINDGTRYVLDVKGPLFSRFEGTFTRRQPVAR